MARVILITTHTYTLKITQEHRKKAETQKENSKAPKHRVDGRDGRPVPRGTLPAGKGGFPAPPRAVGRGGFPAPPRPVKMIKTAGKLRGKIKARISTFSNRGNQ